MELFYKSGYFTDTTVQDVTVESRRIRSLPKMLIRSKKFFIFFGFFSIFLIVYCVFGLGNAIIEYNSSTFIFVVCLLIVVLLIKIIYLYISIYYILIKIGIMFLVKMQMYNTN